MTENEMRLDRDGVAELVNTAHAEGKSPDLRGLNLRALNLSGLNLRNADLRRANLRDANLWGAHLREANLRGADLRGTNLQYAYLRCADLRETDLRYANLRGVYWGGLQIAGLPSGQLILTPTCDGWKLRVGCWKGTPDQLRALIAQDEGWPEAKGEEIARRRPYLQAALALCEVHMQDHADVIDDLKGRWGDD